MVTMGTCAELFSVLKDETLISSLKKYINQR